MIAGPLAALAMTTPAQAQARPQAGSFSIPSGPLDQALRRYGQQSGQRIIFSDALVVGRRSPAVQGALSPDAALDRVLSGSGLIYSRTRSGVLMIIARPPAIPDSEAAVVSDEPVELEPVTVVALKRPQLLREAPMSISVFDREIAEYGLEDLGDIVRRAPGAQLNVMAPGFSSVTIRGIATRTDLNRGQSTTGYFVNGVSVTDPYFAGRAADFDLFDLEAVTVLRGPQTTIYGASAFSGAVNYQLRAPSLTQASSRLYASAGATEGGGESFAMGGMVNAPIIEDVLAIRASYIHRVAPGHIDNTGTGQTDANETVSRMGRLQLIWTSGPATKVSLLYMVQDHDTADLGYQRGGTPGQKTTIIPERAVSDLELGILRLDRNLSVGNLTILASWNDKHAWWTLDNSPSDQFQLLSRQTLHSDTSNLEARFSSSIGSWNYLIGAAYENTRARLGERMNLGIPSQTASFQDEMRYRARVLAVFADATYRFDDQWALEIGGRLFEMRNDETLVGNLRSLSRKAVDERGQDRTRTSGFIPRASITWTPNDRWAAWATIARGSRYAGGNLVPSRPLPEEQATFGPDMVTSFEIGVRAQMLDRRLQWDASAFYVDWHDVQITESDRGFGLTSNYSRAESVGLEGSGRWKISDNWSVRANLSYTEARPLAAGVIGDIKLTDTARWRLTDDITYSWPSAPLRPRLTLSHRFESGGFSSLTAEAVENASHVFSARLSLELGDAEGAIFIDNITNAEGAACECRAQFVERPLRVGVSIDRFF